MICSPFNEQIALLLVADVCLCRPCPGCRAVCEHAADHCRLPGQCPRASAASAVVPRAPPAENGRWSVADAASVSTAGSATAPAVSACLARDAFSRAVRVLLDVEGSAPDEPILPRLLPPRQEPRARPGGRGPRRQARAAPRLPEGRPLPLLGHLPCAKYVRFPLLYYFNFRSDFFSKYMFILGASIALMRKRSATASARPPRRLTSSSRA